MFIMQQLSVFIIILILCPQFVLSQDLLLPKDTGNTDSSLIQLEKYTLEVDVDGRTMYVDTDSIGEGDETYTQEEYCAIVCELTNEGLIKMLSMNVTCNDDFGTAQDIVEDEFDDDYEAFLEDCQGNDLLNDIYYVLISVDASDYAILDGDSKDFLESMRDEMDSQLEPEDYEDESADSGLDIANLTRKINEMISSVQPNVNKYIEDLNDLIDDDYDGEWEDAADALRDSDEQLAAETYMLYVQISIEDMAFLAKETQDILEDYFAALQEDYGYLKDKSLLQLKNTKRNAKVYNQNTLQGYYADVNVLEDFCEGLVEATALIVEVNSEVNDLLNYLDDVEDEKWGDREEAAYDCYHYNPDLTDWLLLEWSILDLKEIKYLSNDNRKFLTSMQNEFMDLYDEEEADLYSFIGTKQVEGVDLFIQIQDDGEIKNSTKSVEYEYVTRETQEPSQRFLNLTLEAIQKVEDGYSESNYILNFLDEFWGEYYDDDFEDLGRALYETDETSTEHIYAWLAHYDAQQITFITDDNIQFLEDFQKELDYLFEDIAPRPTKRELDDDDSVEDFIEAMIYGMELALVGDTEADAVFAVCDEFVEKKWDGDKGDAAEKCYEIATESCNELFSYFQVEDVDELKWIKKEEQKFLKKFWKKLKTEYKDNEADKYEFVQTKESKTSYSYDENVAEMCEQLVQITGSILEVDSKVNDEINELDDLIDDHWESKKDAVYDCYRFDSDLTDWVLLEWAILDFRENGFLTSSNRKWMRQMHTELKDCYEEEEADQFDFLQRNRGKSYMIRDQLLLDNKVSDKSEIGESETTNRYTTDKEPAELILDYLYIALNQIEEGNETVNYLVDDIENFADEYYDNEGEDLAKEMYDADEERTAYIYAWVVHYDVKEITFLTDDNIAFFEDLRGVLDDVMEDVACIPTNYSLDSGDSTEDFMSVLYQGLEASLQGDTEADAIFAECEQFIQDKWDGDYEEAAEKSYEINRDLSDKIYSLFQIQDVHDLKWVDEDNLDFIKDYWQELRNIYEDEEASKYEFLQTKLSPNPSKILSLLQKSANSNSSNTTSSQEVQPIDAQQLANMIIYALEAVAEIDFESNVYIDDVETFIEENFDEDTEQAMNYMIQGAWDDSSDIYVTLNSWEIDDLAFLFQDKRDYLQDLYDGMETYYDTLLEDWDE